MLKYIFQELESAHTAPWEQKGSSTMALPRLFSICLGLLWNGGSFRSTHGYFCPFSRPFHLPNTQVNTSECFMTCLILRSWNHVAWNCLPTSKTSDPSYFMRYNLYLLENCNQLFDFYSERHGLLRFHQYQNKRRAMAETVNLLINGGRKYNKHRHKNAKRNRKRRKQHKRQKLHILRYATKDFLP